MTEVSPLIPVQCQKLLEIMSQAVDDIWEVERLCVGPMGQPRPYPLYTLVGLAATDAEMGRDFISKTFDRMLEAISFDKNELSRQVATVYYRPSLWLNRFSWDFTLPDTERYRRHGKGEIIQVVLSTWLRLNPTIAGYSLMSERIETLLKGPAAKLQPDLYHPTLADMIEGLIHDTSEFSTDIGRQLIVGSMGMAEPESVEETELRRLSPALYLKLWKLRNFDYPIFKQAMYALPGVFQDLSVPLDRVPTPPAYRDLPGDFAFTLQNFCQLLATELAEKLSQLDEPSVHLLKQVSDLRGITWILMSCSFIEEKKLKRLPASNQWRNRKNQASAAVRLCITRRMSSAEEDPAGVIGFLCEYKPETLLLVLPFAKEYQDLICRALNWPGVEELVKFIEDSKISADLENLPLVQKDHAEQVIKTFQAHLPARRALLDRIKAYYDGSTTQPPIL